MEVIPALIEGIEGEMALGVKHAGMFGRNLCM
jgi:hypothetical protein